ncbi:MAG: PEP/pyruvate-binding domain-containing protein, partial [Desulfovibrio sp.]
MFQFGTKAETLERIAAMNAGVSFQVPAVFYFSVARWRAEREAVLSELTSFAGGEFIVVRSSSLGEDMESGSMAGAFESCLNIDPDDHSQVVLSVEKVIASMTGHPADQVLIQPMLADIDASGVIMTRNLEDGSPYYVLNYDDQSGSTESVTSGTGIHKTVYVYRGLAHEYIDSQRVRSMLLLAEELERLCGDVPLDIEFALSLDGTIYLLQVRRICTVGNWHPDVENRVRRMMPSLEDFLSRRSERKPGLFGGYTVLGNMPDWNPAEIIGTRARPLAASLYRELITRRVWSQARELMGYRKMVPEELMVRLAGQPFIDVRASFNSFLPRSVDPVAGEKLVTAWLDRLCAHPELHDKVEFEVALTLRDFCFDATMAERYPRLLTDSELAG